MIILSHTKLMFTAFIVGVVKGEKGEKGDQGRSIMGEMGLPGEPGPIGMHRWSVVGPLSTLIRQCYCMSHDLGRAQRNEGRARRDGSHGKQGRTGGQRREGQSGIQGPDGKHGRPRTNWSSWTSRLARTSR